MRKRITATCLIAAAVGLTAPAAAVMECRQGTGGPVECREHRWDREVYYRYTFSAPAAGQATLRLTAVDEHEVFFNGSSLGAGDGDWTTVEEYGLTLERGENDLAVRVVNRGRGGNGLIAEIRVAENDVRVSRPGGLNLWRWTGAPQRGSSWQTADVSEDPAWKPVQLGYLDGDELAGGIGDSGAEVIAGFPGGVDTGRPQGGMTLRTIQGENIALGLSSNMPDAFDGQGDTFWRITPLQRNVFAEVDLSSRRLIGQVRVLTRGGSPEEFAENSIRGYAVETSDDGIHFVGVRTLTGIADFEQTKATFTPLVTRFVRVVAIDINPIRNTEIAEIQVFGEGFAPSGQWLSEPLDLGRPDRKNFDRVRWSGQTPEGTAIALRFRSSDDSLTWSDWSAPVTERDAPLIVPEPRRWLQYRAEMVSQFEDAAPRLDTLTVVFGEEVPASQVTGWVVPTRAVLGQDTLFTYTLEADFAAGDLGIERVRIATPSRAQVEEIELPDGVELAETIAWGDALEMRFSSAWNLSGRLVIRFRARLLTNQFAFRPRVTGPGGEVSLDGEEDTSFDADRGVPRTWQSRAADVRAKVLSGVRVRPPVFSPNGDGANEGAVVEFVLARVNQKREVEIAVSDLRGRRVRSLRAGRLSGGEYVLPSGGGDASLVAGYWDGRDDAGNAVSPGIYIVRVKARVDRGHETGTASVAVVY